MMKIFFLLGPVRAGAILSLSISLRSFHRNVGENLHSGTQLWPLYLELQVNDETTDTIKHQEVYDLG